MNLINGKMEQEFNKELSVLIKRYSEKDCVPSYVIKGLIKKINILVDKTLVKEVSVKKQRNKKEMTPPTINEWTMFFVVNGYKKDVAENSWKSYDDADWIDSRNNKIFNWKQKARHVWFKPENKTQIVNENRKEEYAWNDK